MNVDTRTDVFYRGFSNTVTTISLSFIFLIILANTAVYYIHFLSVLKHERMLNGLPWSTLDKVVAILVLLFNGC